MSHFSCLLLFFAVVTTLDLSRRWTAVYGGTGRSGQVCESHSGKGKRCSYQNSIQMEIVIDKLGGKSFSVSVSPTSTIAQVKQQVQRQAKQATDEDVLATQTSLKYQDQLLEDTRTLADYSIEGGTTLLASRCFNVNEQSGRFCDNTVTTSQFTCLTFLPKFLFYAFTKAPNAYFLMVMCLQVFPATSQTQGLPTILPMLMIMVSIEGVLLATEDCRRHEADNVANNTTCQIWSPHTGSFEEDVWANIQVGNIVKVHTDEQIPADLAVLGVHQPDENVTAGECYIETKSLDGETSLKQKSALEHTARLLMNDDDVSRVTGVLSTEFPNINLGTFTGVANTVDSKTEKTSDGAIAQSCVLLRGSTLKLTQHAYGLVIYTGHETKVMKNAATPVIKMSTIDREINRLLFYVVAFMWVICLSGGVAGALFDEQNDSRMWYLGVYYTSDTKLDFGDYVIQAVLGWATYWVLLASFVSISLIVSMVAVRSFQVYFMQSNLNMYHHETDTAMACRTFNLNDELGVISFVLSDKTGTLTDNVMQFRKLSVRGDSYGLGQTEIGRGRAKRMAAAGLLVKEPEDEPLSARESPSIHVEFNDETFFSALEDRGRRKAHQRDCKQMVRALALCHAAIRMSPEEEDPLGKLSAASPDELALVEAATFFGTVFARRSKGSENRNLVELERRSEDGQVQIETVELLEDLEFSSERMRQSVIIRDFNTGEIEIISKGADTAMWKRVSKNEDATVRADTKKLMVEQAEDGLRTLLYCHRQLETTWFADWHQQYKAATSDVAELERKKNLEPNRIDSLMDQIERDLEVIGSSALEDKLQAGVPQTIASCIDGGISVWMLTGDKEETAINIGFACSFLTESTDFLKLNSEHCTGHESLRQQMFAFADLITQRKECGSVMRHALVIDGDTLLEAMDVAVLPAFTKMILLCDAVIANRCSPRQKSSTVTMIREQLPEARTLSIGDGANDVPMLMAAHVGVGISGQEGLQAVNNSDFAIARFRFLEDLLLVHGKNNYLNMSTLVCYMFYKNVMTSMTPFYYTAYAGMSGSKFAPEFGLQLVNAVWTFFPILILGTLDQQVSRPVAKKVPQLYHAGLTQSAFNFEVGLEWIILAMAESAFITYVSVHGMGDDLIAEDGTCFGMWSLGLLIFTESVMVVNLKLFAHAHQWTWIHLFFWFFSTLFWWPFCFIAELPIMMSNEFVAVYVEGQLGVWSYLNKMPTFWLVLLLTIGSCALADMARVHLKRVIARDMVHEVQAAVASGASEDQLVQMSHQFPKATQAPPPASSEETERQADPAQVVTLWRNTVAETCAVQDHYLNRTVRNRGSDVEEELIHRRGTNTEMVSAVSAHHVSVRIDEDRRDEDTPGWQHRTPAALPSNHDKLATAAEGDNFVLTPGSPTAKRTVQILKGSPPVTPKSQMKAIRSEAIHGNVTLDMSPVASPVVRGLNHQM